MINIKLITLLYLLTSFIFSNDYNIIGTIIDQDTKKPIKNVNIFIEETNYGTSTDKDGNFQLILTDFNRSVFYISIQIIGYDNKNIYIDSPNKNINFGKISLKNESIKLKASKIHYHDDKIEQISDIKIDGLELQQNLKTNIASTLANYPNIGINSYGTVTSKPSLRGFSGDRFLLTKDGSETGDLSQSAIDHVITLDMAEVESIDIIRGPKSLLFGANAIVFLSKNVPKEFADRLKNIGAGIKFKGDNYEASMIEAEKYARNNNYVLLSDSTWKTCQSGVDVMEGYMIIGEEVRKQLSSYNLNHITHVFLQAGVGGFAAAIALSLRKFLRQDAQIIVVEPSQAKTLFVSLQNKKPSVAEGQVSIMGRLDCKEPSWSAFYSLSKTANYFMHLEDDYVEKKLKFINDFGITTSPSGGAGIAALIYAAENQLFEINKDSFALVFLTEGKI